MKLDVSSGISVSVVYHRDNLLLIGAVLVMKPNMLHFLKSLYQLFLEKEIGRRFILDTYVTLTMRDGSNNVWYGMECYNTGAYVKKLNM